MAIALDDVMGLFGLCRDHIREDSQARGSLSVAIREALAAGTPESELATTLVRLYDTYREMAARHIADATKARKARVPVKTTRMPTSGGGIHG